MMKRNILLFAIAILVMTGCYPATDLSATSMPIPSSIPVVNITDIPSAVPQLETPTSSPTLVPTDTVDSGFKTSCFEVADREIALRQVATGTVILDKDFFTPSSLLDLQTGIEYETPIQADNPYYINWYLSPNKNLLGITGDIRNKDGQFEKMLLWVLNSRAEVLEKIVFYLPDLYNMRWLGNQYLIFYTDQTSKDGTVILFNPFTKEQRYISNDLPEYYVDSYLLPGLSWLIEYSPDLEWGIYLGYTQIGKLGFIIRDFSSNKTMWEIVDFIGEYQKPIWSPSSDDVALVASGDLYLVNRNGLVKSVLSENQVSNPSWSPNGRYIAFWNHDNLMLYDSQNENVYDLCFIGSHLLPLIWSPDSQQFVIPAYMGGNGMLFDIRYNRAYVVIGIPDVVFPIGWMASIP